MINLYPEKSEINYSLAEVDTKKGDVALTISALDSLEEKEGIYEPVIMEKYRLYMTEKEADKAYNEIEKLIKA